jgi:hypothetical protein
MTPEGRVKAAVNNILKPYIKRGYVYKFMPVQSGFGKKTLDYLLCVGGRFVAIETKAPGKKPTPLQDVCIREIRAAGGEVWVISSDVELDLFRDHLYDGYISKHKTQVSWGAA